jgi:hypothetical protein
LTLNGVHMSSQKPSQPIIPIPNKINSLTKLLVSKPIGPKQQALDFYVKRQADRFSARLTGHQRIGRARDRTPAEAITPPQRGSERERDGVSRRWDNERIHFRGARVVLRSGLWMECAYYRRNPFSVLSE